MYELAYYDSAVHRFNHYTTRTPWLWKVSTTLNFMYISHSVLYISFVWLDFRTYHLLWFISSQILFIPSICDGKMHSLLITFSNKPDLIRLLTVKWLWLTKAWTAIDRLSIIWKSNLTHKMKRSFFQAAVVSILLYGCTTWTLTKRLEKKLDDNYTRMLRAILNWSWQQHPTRCQLYGHLPPITKTIQARRTKHAGYC